MESGGGLPAGPRWKKCGSDFGRSAPDGARAVASSGIAAVVGGPEVFDRVCAAAADGQHMVDAQSVSQACRVGVDHRVADGAAPAVDVGDQPPQLRLVPASPASSSAHAPKHTPSEQPPATRIPPVGDTRGRTDPPSPQPGSGPGTGTTRVGDSPSPQGGGRRGRRIAAGGAPPPPPPPPHFPCLRPATVWRWWRRQ